MSGNWRKRNGWNRQNPVVSWKLFRRGAKRGRRPSLNKVGPSADAWVQRCLERWAIGLGFRNGARDGGIVRSTSETREPGHFRFFARLPQEKTQSNDGRLRSPWRSLFAGGWETSGNKRRSGGNGAGGSSSRQQRQTTDAVARDVDAVIAVSYTHLTLPTSDLV